MVVEENGAAVRSRMHPPHAGPTKKLFKPDGFVRSDPGAQYGLHPRGTGSRAGPQGTKDVSPGISVRRWKPIADENDLLGFAERLQHRRPELFKALPYKSPLPGAGYADDDVTARVTNGPVIKVKDID